MRKVDRVNKVLVYVILGDRVLLTEPAKVCVQPAAPEYSPSIYARAGEGGRALLGVGRDPGVVVACSAVVTGDAPHRAVP